MGIDDRSREIRREVDQIIHAGDIDRYIESFTGHSMVEKWRNGEIGSERGIRSKIRLTAVRIRKISCNLATKSEPKHSTLSPCIALGKGPPQSGLGLRI